MTEMAGGCLCGAKRFVVDVTTDEAILCHCRMCQRWSGNVWIAFTNLPAAEIRWTAPPDYYRSSPIARRGHCATCGTALTFEYLDEDKVDLTVASFDDPSHFRPTCNYAVESRHAAWVDVGDLPTMRSDENEPTVERWMKACGKLPD